MSAPDTSLPQQPQSAVPQVNVLPQPQAPSTSGMTEMSPEFSRQQQGSKWSARGLPAIAMSIVGQVQKRKQRETEQVIQQFVGNYKGMEEAKSQLQQIQQQNMKLAQAFQAAQTPEEKQQIQQQLQQSVQQARQLQGSMETNRQNLREMFNGKNQEKHSKIISKAFGIDDKNAATPERQAAVKVIQDQMKLDQKSASMISRLPQRQQLSPEARAQQQMVQGGVMGKPATGGQMLNAQSKNADRVLNAEKMINAVGLNNEKMVEQVRRQSGLVPVRDDKGTIKRNPDGTMQTRNLKPEEMTAEEYARYQDVKAQTDLRTAQAKAAPIKAQAQMMNAQRVRKEHADMATPGYVAAWAKAVQDPTQKVTIAQVPQAARGAVLAAVQASGGKLAIPLGGDEIKRMDLATNAVTNVEEMQKILEEHPELFGPAGWGSSKFEQMLGSDDPMAVNARRFLAAKSLANLPAVGVHGVRGKWALEDLDKLDGNLYQSADSMRGVLEEIHRSASEFKDLADRPASIRGTAGGGQKETKEYQGRHYERNSPSEPWHVVKTP
jgi:hypothetical protein